MKTRTGLMISALSLAALFVAVGFTVRGQRMTESKDAPDTQWEYLVVAGGNSNFSTAGNDQYPGMRKQPDTSFARELFPLERNFDKLGAKGWQLVAVHGGPGEPFYYFKRLKESR